MQLPKTTVISLVTLTTPANNAGNTNPEQVVHTVSRIGNQKIRLTTKTTKVV